VSFFEVETWAKLAENCNNLGRKGRGVRVVGRLKQERWTGNDGKQHSKIAIVAEHVEFRPEFKKETDNHAGTTAEEPETSEALAGAVFTEQSSETMEEIAGGGYAAEDYGSVPF
jgi:single-strand DNA-binding protein